MLRAPANTQAFTFWGLRVVLSDYIRFSFLHLKGRKLRSYLTTLGIFIGIAAVVSFIALGEGLREAVLSQFGFLGADLVRVNTGSDFGPPGGTVVEKPLTKSDVDELGRMLSVRSAMGRVVRSTTMEFNKKSAAAMITTMPDGIARKELEEVIHYVAEKGRLLEDGDKSSVVVGASLADKDTFGKAIVPGAKVTINDKIFTVAGVLEKKGSFILDGAVLMNEQPARELLKVPVSSYDLIALRARSRGEVDEVKSSAEKLLRRRRGVKEGEEDFSVVTAASAISGISDVLLGVNIFVWIIAGISVVVGGIGILNTMYTAVMERTREIGVLKSIGATKFHIFLLFFAEAGFLGLVGGLLGVGAGMLLTTGMVAVGKAVLGSGLIRAEFSFWLIIGSLASSFFLGALFGVSPALRAANKQPVESLRFAG